MADQKCSECGGEVIGPVTVDPMSGDAGATDLQLKVMPTSGMVKRPVRAAVHGMLCTDCGRVEMRAEPREIADAWRDGAR